MTCESKYFVYALVDPFNNYPFYIGKGCGDRPYKHLDGRDNGNIAKAQTEKRFEIQDIDALREEYLVSNISRKTLAKKYGCSEAVLKRILSENNIRKYKKGL